MIEIAAVALARDEDDEAQWALRALQLLGHNDLNTAALWALHCRRQGRLAEAARCYERIVADNPDDVGSRYLADMLAARTLGETPPAAAFWPTPFAVRTNVLPLGERERFWAWCSDAGRRWGETRDNDFDEDLCKFGGLAAPARVVAAEHSDGLYERLRPAMEEMSAQLGFQAPSQVSSMTIVRQGPHDFAATHRVAESDSLTFAYVLQPPQLRFRGGGLRLFDTNRGDGTYQPNFFTRLLPADNMLVGYPAFAFSRCERIFGDREPLPANGRFIVSW